MANYRKRRKLRLKPRAYFFLILFILIIIFIIYTLFFSEKEKNNDNNSSVPSISIDLKEGYKAVSVDQSQLYAGDLILVNSDQKYHSAELTSLVSVFDYKTDCYSVKDTDVQVDKRMVEAFNLMMDDFYNATGLDDVMVISGYRSQERQSELYNEQIEETGTSTTVQMPGHSEHETGLALDLGLEGDGRSFDGSGEYKWIIDNCHKYGLVLRYPNSKINLTKIDYEPWHLRYVGVTHATIMHEKGLCLEEYIDYLKNYTYDGEHLMTDNAEIYFVEATGEETQVPIPEHMDKSIISGNNVDGYIVTIDIN